jgi:hypothetical protein
LKQPIWLGWIQPIKQLKRKKKNYWDWAKLGPQSYQAHFL